MELSALNWLQANLRCDFLDEIMVRLTALGNGGAIWIALAAGLLCFPKTRRVGLAVAFSLLIEAMLCNLLLKPLVARVRPFDINTAVQLLIPPPTDSSFPSGHTGAAFAVVSALFFGRSRLWLPMGLIAVLMAFSRLYLYVHYPSDVLGGALLGMACGWLGCRLSRLLAK